MWHHGAGGLVAVWGELNSSQYSRDQTHQTHQTQGRQAANSNGSRKSDTEQGREAVRPSPVACHSPHILLTCFHSAFTGSLYLQQLKQSSLSLAMPSQPLLRLFLMTCFFFPLSHSVTRVTSIYSVQLDTQKKEHTGCSSLKNAGKSKVPDFAELAVPPSRRLLSH